MQEWQCVVVGLATSWLLFVGRSKRVQFDFSPSNEIKKGWKSWLHLFLTIIFLPLFVWSIVNLDLGWMVVFAAIYFSLTVALLVRYNPVDSPA